MAVSRLSQQSLINAFPKGNTIWDGTTSVGSMEAISSVLVTTATNSITFSSIPQTYQHLILRGIYVGTSSNDDVVVQFNGITSAVYAQHGLYGVGNGSTPSTTYGVSSTGMYLATNAGDGTNPTISVCEILDYKDTNKYTVLRAMTGLDRNGSGQIQFYSGSYQQVTAVSEIKVYTPVGNLGVNTHYSLYGVK